MKDYVNDELLKQMLGDLSMIQCNLHQADELEKSCVAKIDTALDYLKQVKEVRREIDDIMQAFVSSFSTYTHTYKMFDKPEEKPKPKWFSWFKWGKRNANI